MKKIIIVICLPLVGITGNCMFSSFVIIYILLYVVLHFLYNVIIYLHFIKIHIDI